MGKVNIGWNSRFASTKPVANTVPKYDENGVLHSSIINSDTAPETAVINKLQFDSELITLKNSLNALYGSNNTQDLKTRARMDNDLAFLIEREEDTTSGYKERFSFFMGGANDVWSSNVTYIRPNTTTNNPEKSGYISMSTIDDGTRPSTTPQHENDITIQPHVAAGNNQGAATGLLGDAVHPWKSLHVNTVYSPNGINTTSDERLKENISKDFTTYKKLFKELKPISYNYCYLNDGKTRLGFSAQEVEAALTKSGIDSTKFAGLRKETLDLNKYLSEGETLGNDCYLKKYLPDGKIYSLDYTEFIALNTAMIQDLQTQVDGVLATNDAMLFKGTINNELDLPSTHLTGWTYRVNSSGKYAGKQCEVGDLIICIEDGTSSNNDHWTVAQTNIEGAVTGPTSAITDNIAVFCSTGGNLIEDSGVSITDIENLMDKKYAGSSTAGGSANSAVKLDDSAGSEIQPVYFKEGKPVPTNTTPVQFVSEMPEGNEIKAGIIYVVPV